MWFQPLTYSICLRKRKIYMHFLDLISWYWKDYIDPLSKEENIIIVSGFVTQGARPSLSMLSAWTPIVCFSAYQRKHQITAWLAFVLWRESKGDRWISLIRDQKRGKYFHLMTPDQHINEAIRWNPQHRRNVYGAGEYIWCHTGLDIPSNL